MSKYPKPLLSLIAHLKKLPGVGQKTAERFAFRLIEWKEDDLIRFGQQLEHLKKSLPHCDQCGCIIDEACPFCKQQRDSDVLCLIASPKDAYAIEETGSFRGRYHVLGGLLSPMDGLLPDNLNIEKFLARIVALSVKEVIIALDSTLEGDATALYLKKILDETGTSVSRLAHGVPLGSSLDLLDEGTLSKALIGRQVLH